MKLPSIPLIWFLAGTLLIVLEFMVPGVVLIFFGISAWLVAGLLAFFNFGFAWQLAVWLVLSFVLLFSLRKWLSAQFKGFTGQKSDLKTLRDEAEGQRVEVIETIDPVKLNGHVRWKGTDWKAEADEIIPEGTMVEIVEQNNLILRVKRIN